MAAEVQSLSLQQLLSALVTQRGPLQLEEQQCRSNLGLTLLHFLQQCAVRRSGGVCGETQDGVGAGPADQLVDDGQLGHRLPQARAVELAELAGIALGECLRPRQGVLQPALDAGLALPVDERLEVPGGLGQLVILRGGAGRVRASFSLLSTPASPSPSTSGSRSQAVSASS